MPSNKAVKKKHIMRSTEHAYAKASPSSRNAKKRNSFDAELSPGRPVYLAVNVRSMRLMFPWALLD